MSRAQVSKLLAKSKPAAIAGKFELFKTSSHFDSTAKNPDWLGGDTPEVEKLAPAAYKPPTIKSNNPPPLVSKWSIMYAIVRLYASVRSFPDMRPFSWDVA
jgi:hypothetical protein